ncbi:MAG: ABC-F family ATP-binding cassette domain-containing protein [Planctomycetota bacterium]
MILLTVDQVRKHFGPEPVLDGVTFDVRPGQRISLIGPNGAGKTTLMRIIAGQEEPDAGTVSRHPSARLGYLEQQPDFAPGRTVWDEASAALSDLEEITQQVEQVAVAISEAVDEDERRRLETRFDHLQHELQHRDAYNIKHRIERVLNGLGFNSATYQQPVTLLSGGQQNRLLLARLLLAEPDLMLLDEPSNHLDIEATEWLEDFLVSSQQAILVVSHDRYFLDKVTNRTLELLNGTVDAYPGNFTAYRRQKAERLEVQRRTFEKQQQEIAKMEDFVRRNTYGQKSAQAEDRRKKLERIERVDRPREIVAPLMSFPPASRTGDIVMRVENLSKRFDRPLFDKLSFDVLRGEKWGILGPNGCGKTTLLRCLVGQQSIDSGTIHHGAGVKVGYFDQMLSCLRDEAEVVEAIRPDHKEFNLQQRRDLLARFGITGDMVFQRVDSLSGGERNRSALAWLSGLDANLLILDEPTNHLDLWARGALEKAMRDFDGSVILVSHDRYFLNQVCDRLLVVEPGRFRVIEGNYETYVRLVKQGFARGVSTVATNSSQKTTTGASGTSGSVSGGANGGASGNGSSRSGQPTTGETSGKPAKRKRKFPYRKVADIEAEIQQVEGRVAELHDMMTQSDVLRDGRRMKEVNDELTAAEATIGRLMEHWEEAVELN